MELEMLEVLASGWSKDREVPLDEKDRGVSSDGGGHGGDGV